MVLLSLIVPLVCCSISALIGFSFGRLAGVSRVFPGDAVMHNNHSAFLIGWRGGYAAAILAYAPSAMRPLAVRQTRDIRASWERHWSTTRDDYAKWCKEKPSDISTPEFPS